MHGVYSEIRIVSGNKTQKRHLATAQGARNFEQKLKEGVLVGDLCCNNETIMKLIID